MRLYGPQAVLLFALGLILLPACGGLPPFPAEAESQKRLRSLRDRASFDLECEANELELIPIGYAREVEGTEFYFQYGVTGCGRRSVYVDLHDDNLYDPRWVADSGNAVATHETEPPRRRPHIVQKSQRP